MTDALRLDPLTAPLTRGEVRRYRLATGSEKKKFWAKLGGFLGTLALIVFLSFYLSDWEFSLVPWLAGGLTLLFLLAWVLTQRAAARRWRLRCRLARFAAANALTLDVDVPLPAPTDAPSLVAASPAPAPPAAHGTPVPAPPASATAPAPADGEITAIPVRLRGVDARGEWEAGVCTCYERSASGSTTSSVDRVYLMADPTANVLIAQASWVVPFRRERLGAGWAIVFTDSADLASPSTWATIARLRSRPTAP